MDFIKRMCREKNLKELIWESEIFVKPEYQRMKIASLLRKAFIDYIEQTRDEGVLILTRMRDDNRYS